MSHKYKIYGLKVLSEDAIPGLTPSSYHSGPDLKVYFGSLPRSLGPDSGAPKEWYVSGEHDSGEPTLRVWSILNGKIFRFLYYDKTEFVVDGGGTHVWVRWPSHFDPEDAAIYLLGPILGFVLLLRGTVCLHASSVALEKGALAFVGAPGAGKSTIAAAFAGLGYAVVTDDVVSLSDRGDEFHVQPGYPCIRLWPKSVQALYGDPEALPLLTRNWEKRGLFLGESGGMFQSESMKLKAVYLLGERSDEASAPRVEPVAKSEGLIDLVKNTYVNYLKKGGAKSLEFQLLSRLVSAVEIRRIIPHKNIGELHRLCDIVVSDFENRIKHIDCSGPSPVRNDSTHRTIPGLPHV